MITFLEKKDFILRYAIELPFEFLENLEKGASMSIDGVCQTVVDIQKNQVWFEAIDETLARTTLSMLKIGSSVNVERSAKIGDEIGGHLLSGHIYGIATIVQINKNIFTFVCHSNSIKYLFSKGYVAIDGISLTLVDVNYEGYFTVHLIPETLKRTTLGQKKIGDGVNLELDTYTQTIVDTIENYLYSLCK